VVGAREIEAGGLSGETGRRETRNQHGEAEGIRAARASLVSRNPDDEVADELAQIEGEIADAASLSTASDRLVSDKTAPTPRSRCCVSGRKTPDPPTMVTRAGAEL
jgi:hypothetical protein